MVKRMYSIIFYTVIIVFLSSNIAYAATYTKVLTEWYSGFNDASDHVAQSLDIHGFNLTHGFSMPIKIDARATNVGSKTFKLELVYELPDDGSTWIVAGNAIFSVLTSDGGAYYQRDFPVYEVHNTPGTFTGVSIGQAVNAANSAKSAADTAASRANTAASNASTAATNATQAKTAAENALSKASDAANYTWHSGSNESVADIAANIRML